MDTILPLPPVVQKKKGEKISHIKKNSASDVSRIQSLHRSDRAVEFHYRVPTQYNLPVFSAVSSGVSPKLLKPQLIKKLIKTSELKQLTSEYLSAQ